MHYWRVNPCCDNELIWKVSVHMNYMYSVGHKHMEKLLVVTTKWARSIANYVIVSFTVCTIVYD